jgi:hypothetical protein
MKPELNYKAANVRQALDRIDSLEDKMQVMSDLIIEVIMDEADGGKKLFAANEFITRFGRDFNEVYRKMLGFQQSRLVA